METMDELRQHLRDNGYAKFMTRDESNCVAVDEWQLDRTSTGWRVGFFERGQLTTALLETTEETAAVQLFLRTVSNEIYHVKTFKNAGDVGCLEAVLQEANLPYCRNDVPHEGQLRVFVSGPNLRQ